MIFCVLRKILWFNQDIFHKIVYFLWYSNILEYLCICISVYLHIYDLFTCFIEVFNIWIGLSDIYDYELRRNMIICRYDIFEYLHIIYFYFRILYPRCRLIMHLHSAVLFTWLTRQNFYAGRFLEQTRNVNPAFDRNIAVLRIMFKYYGISEHPNRISGEHWYIEL